MDKLNGRKIKFNLKTKLWLSNILIYLFLGFMIVISVLPLVWVILSSFKTNSEILNNPFTLPSSIGFEQYKYCLLYTSDAADDCCRV